MLIVIEGLDGSGKSTQVKLLREFLESQVEDFNYLHFPRFDSPVFGELIAMFLRGDFGEINEVHPMLVALLFAGDRRDASTQALEWLNSGGVVLYDRYVYSNIAFQCAKVENVEEAVKLRNWIIKTEFKDFSIPRPDVNIFLDMPISFVEKNLNAERTGDDRDYLRGKEDIHESQISFQERVREIYLDLVSLDDNFIRIDCVNEEGKVLTPSEIFEKIKEVIKKYK